MGLLHDFFLLPAGVVGMPEGYVGRRGEVCLHDDLVSYLWDQLCWLPTRRPHSRAASRGLSRWDATLIATEDADKAALLFARWAALLELGPEVLKLRGEWETEPDGTEGRVRLHLDREATVATLRALAQMAEEASATGRSILHLGI